MAHSRKIPSIFSFEYKERNSILTEFTKHRKIQLNKFFALTDRSPFLGLLRQNLELITTSRFTTGKSGLKIMDTYVAIVKQKYVESIQDEDTKESAHALLEYFSSDT